VFEKIFKLTRNKTTMGRELSAGATTFLTMSYIIFVQPIILSLALHGQGDEAAFKAGVMAATCIASALATFLMGFLANYPIALAPAMGHNIFFAVTVCGSAAAGGFGFGWNAALGAVFISGSIFIALSFFGFREKLVNAIPRSIKNAIAVGIGLLIAVIGLEYAGIVVPCPGTYIGVNPGVTAGVTLALIGLVLMCVLIALKVRGAILLATLATALIGAIPWFGVVKLPEKVVSLPHMSYTLLALDIPGVFTVGTGAAAVVIVIFVFFFLDLFDTVGTLVGIGERAGFMNEDGTLPRARQALFSDASGTVIGALLGTSTVTSYIESTAGVASGARTGLANMATGVLFLFALFFGPIVEMVGAAHVMPSGVATHPVIAPALIVVGAMMMKSVLRIDWDDPTEYLPAFLTIMIMPLTFNIALGIGFGFVTYTLLKAVTRRLKDGSLLIYVFAGLFVLYFIFVYVPTLHNWVVGKN
jgi:AGZA family xanthine/uracil permease-like MFS transporter